MIVPVCIRECVIGLPGHEDPFDPRCIESIWKGNTLIKTIDETTMKNTHELINKEKLPHITYNLTKKYDPRVWD